MNKSIKAIIIATAASGLALPAVSQASDFQYDGVELSYGSSTFAAEGPINEFDVDAAGLELNYSVTSNIVVGGIYQSAKGDPSAAVQGLGTQPGDYEATVTSLLAFYHAEINEKMDYQVGATYSRTKTDFSIDNANPRELEPLNGSDDSKSVIGGIRYRFNEKIELGVRADYDLDADDDKFSYELGARYQVLPDLDVSFNVDFHDGGRSLRASVKKYLDFSR